MAYTGTCTLEGDKLGLFYQYVQEKLGYCVMTHELAYPEVQDAIKEAARDDFIELCKSSDEPRVMTLEELDTAPSGYIVLQTRDMPDMLEWYDGLLFSVNVNWTVDIITLEGKKRLKKDDYGIKWRCWTARPTEEQREAQAGTGRTDANQLPVAHATRGRD